MNVFEKLTKSEYPYIILNTAFYYNHINKLLFPIFNNFIVYLKTKISNTKLNILHKFFIYIEKNNKTIKILTNLKNKLTKKVELMLH